MSDDNKYCKINARMFISARVLMKAHLYKLVIKYIILEYERLSCSWCDVWTTNIYNAAVHGV